VEAPPVSARRDYGDLGLDVGDLDPDPLAQLQRWLDHAATSDQLVEPSAMALATVDDEGRPALRTVLLRGVHDGRLLFFTSYGSRKGRHLARNPHVALLFRWAHPTRQVEVRGTAVPARPEESDAYFATRPRGSRIGAHASPQSQPIADRAALEQAVDDVAAAFDGVADVPRPEGWGGYAVTPVAFEFWQGRRSRLHDRFTYTRDAAGGWRIQRLAP
jgi:pyridoxamine 5'-phosphate oxidase